MRNPSYLT